MPINQEGDEAIKGQGWDIIKDIIKRLPMNKLTPGMVFVIIGIILTGFFIPKLYTLSPAICIVFMIMVFSYSMAFIFLENKKQSKSKT